MNKIILPIRFAFAITGSLIGYFLLLSLFELHVNPMFSLFNGVITGFGLFEAIKYRKLELGSDFQYSNGFSTGIVAGFISTLLFSIFMAVYVTEVNTDFLHALLTSWDSHFDISVGAFIFVVALMGLATAVVLTLTIMQFFKKPIK